MAEKIQMISLSPTMEEGTIIKWLKNENDKISSGDVICEVETDKASMDYESTQEGILLKIITEEGSSAAVGKTIAVIGKKGEDISAILAETDSPAAVTKSETKPEKDSLDNNPSQVYKKASAGNLNIPDNRIKASPLARKIAGEKGIDLASVKGSGPDGRIIKKDIEGYNSGTKLKASSFGTDKIIELSSKRKVIAKRLSQSMFSAPHYYLKLSVSASGMIESRKKINSTRDQNISINAFLFKFTAENLKKHPYLNSSWRGNDILLFGSIDIALAVALDDGLVTPVVRNCGNKSISVIDAELKELVSKAKSGKLQPDEYSNATFTISNLGSSGIEEFTAVINPPGSAILAVGAVIKTALVMPDNTVYSDDMMKLTLSCDHRVIDGKVGADFLSDLKKSIEDPVYALL